MKKLVYVLIVALCLQIVTVPGYAKEDENNAANILNKLDILRGDGNSFQLDGVLNRAEGATFVVRMLGKEDEVMADRGHYVMTGFSDISATDWYAPYVGYCVENDIINGYTDGTYKPMESLSEQAMLKILLVALGYDYEEDFEWTTTFQKAFEAGLVTDNAYALGNGQSSAFTRGDVVGLIYRTLKMNHNKSGSKMVLSLLADDAVDEALLLELGLVVEPGSLAVSDFRRIGKNYFSLEFKGVPESVTTENVNIEDREGGYLEITEVAVTDRRNVFSVKTEDEDKDAVYDVTVENVKDTYGNTFEAYSNSFLGYRPNVYESDIFAISTVKQQSRQMVDLTFTHPISDKGLNADYFYILDGDDNVIADGGSGDEMTVTKKNSTTVSLRLLKTSFVVDETYTVIVRDEFKSDYRVYLNQHQDDRIHFVADDYEEDAFSVDYIEMIDTNKIRVIVNRPVNVTIGEQIFSYYLTDRYDNPIAITKAMVSNTSDLAFIVLETGSSIKEDNDYYLMINQLYTTDRSASIIEKTFDFEAQYDEIDEVGIEQVVQLDYYTLQVEFEQHMNEADILDPSNYGLEIDHGSVEYEPVAIYYNDDDRLATLYFGEEAKMKMDFEYRFIVYSGMSSKEGGTLEKSYVEKFKASRRDDLSVDIDKAVYLGDSILLVSLDNPIAFDASNISTDNFSLVGYSSEENRDEKISGESEYIDAVIYYDSKHLLLLVSDFDDSDFYQLTINSIVGYNQWTVVETISEPVMIAED